MKTNRIVTSFDVAAISHYYCRIWRDLRVAIVWPLSLIAMFSLLSIGQLAGDLFQLDLELVDDVLGQDVSQTLIVGWNAVLIILGLFVVFWIGRYRPRRLLIAGGALVIMAIIAILYNFDALTNMVQNPSDVGSSVPLVQTSLAIVPAIEIIIVLRLLYSAKLDPHGTTAPPIIGMFHRAISNRRKHYKIQRLAKPLWLLVALLLIAAVYIFIVLMNLLIRTFLLDWPEEVFEDYEELIEFSRLHPGQYWGGILLDVVQFVLIIAAAIYIIRFFLRLAARRADRILSNPAYSPIVILRSFSDEGASVTSKRLTDRVIFRKRRLEEIAVSLLAPFGPAVAIGLPGERFPQLGAMRAHQSDGDWQAAVLDLMKRAFIIVVVAGSSPWFLWEFRQALDSDPVSQLLVVMPPDASADARAARWAALCEAAQGTPWHDDMVAIAPVQLCAVAFFTGGSLIPIFGGKAHQADYELAIQTATAKLTENQHNDL